MAPASSKKKIVSFVKADKVSVDTNKKQAASSKQKPVASALKKKQTTVTAKKQTSKVNRLAAASKITAAPAGKKTQGKKPSKKSPSGKKAKKASVKVTSSPSPTTFVRRDKKRCAPYVALQLRNLPDAFQEPQLRKFLSQFNVPVSHSFVQRTKKSAASRGLAYIRFAPKDVNQEKALDVILDEVSSMNLGGKTVAAKWVTLTRRMPSRKAADARRQLEYLNKTEGVKLDQFDTRHFDWVARLQRSAKNESTGNKFLKSIGVNYSYTGFNDQLPLLTKQVKEISAQAQKSVKLSRFATKIGRCKGFTNENMLKRTLKKNKRLAKKKKSAKKETPTTKAATPSASTVTATAAPAAVKPSVSVKAAPVAPKVAKKTAAAKPTATATVAPAVVSASAKPAPKVNPKVASAGKKTAKK